jgi:hypothetical protein
MEICPRLAAIRLQFVCDWWPLRYNLHVTASHLDAICMQLAATQGLSCVMQVLKQVYYIFILFI